MRFSDSDYILPAARLAASITHILPDYLPGLETGSIAPTDRRSCWTKSMRHVLEVLGREHRMEIYIDEHSEWGVDKQLKLLWKKGDGVALGALSGWGDREDLERSFLRLETLKAPQKLIVYTCARWQEAVLDQLAGALMRYPHHIEGEEYIALNLLAAESRMIVHTCRIPHSGTLTLQEATLRALPEGPLQWKAAAAR